MYEVGTNRVGSLLPESEVVKGSESNKEKVVYETACGARFTCESVKIKKMYCSCADFDSPHIVSGSGRIVSGLGRKNVPDPNDFETDCYVVSVFMDEKYADYKCAIDKNPGQFFPSNIPMNRKCEEILVACAHQKQKGVCDQIVPLSQINKHYHECKSVWSEDNTIGNLCKALGGAEFTEESCTVLEKKDEPSSFSHGSSLMELHGKPSVPRRLPFSQSSEPQQERTILKAYRRLAKK